MTEYTDVELRALAEAASPGPWSWHVTTYGPPGWWTVFDGNDRTLVDSTDGRAQDAKYIVAASPTTVLSLLDRVGKAEADVAEWQRVAAEQTRLERDRSERAEAAIERVRTLHKRTAFDDEPTEFHCSRCQVTAGIWPCDTVQALDTGKERSGP